MKVPDDYVVPKSNVPFEWHIFRQVALLSDETLDQFVCRPRLRDQVIDKCYSSHFRRKFLEQEGNTVGLLKIPREQRAVCSQLRQMEQKSN